MSNENRELMIPSKQELKDTVTKEGRKLAKGAIEVSRKPLHDLGNNLLDYVIDWVIAKVTGAAN